MGIGRNGTTLVAAATLLTAGCYSYAPISLATTSPGALVRADVTEQAATQLTPVLGPGVVQVHGLLLDRDASTVSILVDSYQTRRAGQLTGVSDPVRLPFDQIERVEQKQLARGRSVLLGIAFIGGALALTEIFGGDERIVEPPDREDPGEPERRPTARIGTKLFSIRFP